MHCVLDELVQFRFGAFLHQSHQGSFPIRLANGLVPGLRQFCCYCGAVCTCRLYVRILGGAVLIQDAAILAGPSLNQES